MAGSDAGYPVPARVHRVDHVIERSRFIATVAPARTPEDARAFIDAVRREFADATHNCWAFLAGPPGSTAAVGFSDAGEPRGTAGRPMLDVLLHSGIGDIAVVVTRYYGGVKLGRGGLGRAYGGAVQLALAALPLDERVRRATVDVTVGYADVDTLRRVVADLDARILDEDYTEVVRYRVRLRAADRATFTDTIRDRTAGRAAVAPAEVDEPADTEEMP